MLEHGRVAIKNSPSAPTQSMVLADQQLEEKVIEGLAVGCCRGLL